MRTLFVVTLSLLTSALTVAQDPVPQPDPESEARAAVRFLEGLPDEDRLYTRLMSTYDVDSTERAEFETLMRVAARQVTLSPNRRVVPARVPDSDTLWWCDLRSMYWNDAAWRAIATRDVAFREPWVSHDVARRMRGLIGETQPKNFHLVGIVSAWGWYRRTYQTVESQDYYDLLFAEQRYPVTGKEYREVLREWGGGRWTDGKVYPKGWYPTQVEFLKRGFKDFPKTKVEWFTAFVGGIDGTEYEKALRGLRSRRGAVVKGMEDAKADVSFVAKNNRVVWMAPALSRFGAVYGETFDVRKSSGKRDLEENAFTDQPRDSKRKFADGGELLFTLPAGDGVAALVVNGEEKRVEEVPPDIAIHTRDARDRRVRNGALACLACHGDAYCWIPLSNVIERDTPDEIDVKFKGHPDGKQARDDYDAFFVGWQDEIKPIREVVRGNWRQLTGTKAKNYEDGWTGLQVAQVSLKWKHKYDDALDIEAMCRSTGAPEPFLRLAAVKAVTRRAADVARKHPVPRTTWDEDVFPELMKLLVGKKERVFP